MALWGSLGRVAAACSTGRRVSPPTAVWQGRNDGAVRHFPVPHPQRSDESEWRPDAAHYAHLRLSLLSCAADRLVRKASLFFLPSFSQQQRLDLPRQTLDCQKQKERRFSSRVLSPGRLAAEPFYAAQPNAAQRQFEALEYDVAALLSPESVEALEGQLDQGYSNVESLLSKLRHLV